MKVILSFTLFLFLIAALDIAVSDKCKCSQLLSQYDCQYDGHCSWDQENQQCNDLTIPSGYCELIQTAERCAETKGCAYIGSSCTYFAGCSAYQGSKNAECQAISRFCISNGSNYCVKVNTCQTYDNYNECNQGSSGAGNCIWDANNLYCREQQCQDADLSLNSDDKCNQFLEGCITKGKGCTTSPLGLCSSYGTECHGLKGSDGDCKVDCKPKECTDYNTWSSQVDCAEYKTGCVNNGIQCVDQPLGPCSSFQITNQSDCERMKGSDGTCKSIGATYCGVATCQDAPITYSSDAECNSFNTGCVTTGQGCVQTRLSCETYSSSYCYKLIGSDGRCAQESKKQSTQCIVKQCEQAENCNSEMCCNVFQFGCVYNGMGCVKQLQQCSSYQGDSNKCLTYIGSDGKCKEGQNGQCAPRVCNEAPTTVKSHQDCQDYQKGCIFSGYSACMQPGQCGYLASDIQCSGVSKCHYTQQCIGNFSCSDFVKEYFCNSVKLQNGDNCQWSDGKCIEKVCNSAPKTYDQDNLCGSFKKGCVTNGAGCVKYNALCSEYSGTKSQCLKYGERIGFPCTNIDDNTTAQCKQKLCSDNKISQSDSECKSYLQVCVTTYPGIPGCIDQSEDCSKYTGSSTDICSKFQGNYSSIPCWWVSGTKCIEKKCSQANFTNNDDCTSFMPKCMTDGNHCIENPAGQVVENYHDACTQLTGTQTECFSQSCSRREPCSSTIPKIVNCTDIQQPISQQSCENALPGMCYLLQNRCTPIQKECKSYKSSTNNNLSLNDCLSLQDINGNPCYWTSGQVCEQKLCSHETTATSMSACQTFLKSCTKKLNGNGCETINCGNVLNPENESTCTSYHPSCHFKYNTTTSKYICYQVNNCNEAVMNPGSKCKEAITNGGDYCIQDGQTNKCKSPDCSIIDKILCNTTKVVQKSDITYTSTPVQLCYYNSTSFICEIRSCASASIHIGPKNLFSRTDCSNYFDQCALTFSGPDGAPICINAIKNSKEGGCSILWGTADQCNNILQGRYYINGRYEWRQCSQTNQSDSTSSNCQDRACNQVKYGYTDNICKTYLSTCKTDGIQCVDQSTPCENMTGTAESCAYLSSPIVGVKCQQNNKVSGICKARLCTDNRTATTDAECESFRKGCITTGQGCISQGIPCQFQQGTDTTCQLLKGQGSMCGSTSQTTAPCENKKCSHNTTATTNKECANFLYSCVTNGAGCISQYAPCSQYHGNQQTCSLFTGNGIKCTNTVTASETTACQNSDCSEVDQATNESDCQKFGKNCHFYGNGCQTLQQCYSLKGNNEDCVTFVSSDGRCKGTDSLQCIKAECSDAPKTYITDEECLKWKSDCVTDGAGCQNKNNINCDFIATQSACLAHLNQGSKICTWISQCQDKPTSCSTIKERSFCINYRPLTEQVACTWQNGGCVKATCSDILDKHSEEDCFAYSSTCTYSGSGCVTKGACTSYNTEQVCMNAKTTDPEGCFWNHNYKSCNVNDCKNSPNSLNYDYKCDAFKSGCVTNGAGCALPPLQCKDFVVIHACLQDSSKQPCFWFKNTCYQYYECESLPLVSVSECQQANKYCTSDGIKCIALQTCENYTLKNLCQIGINGECGWINSTVKCQKFTDCSDIKSNIDCQDYNSKCIVSGTECIQIVDCYSYQQNKDLCIGKSINGHSCYFDAQTGCRPMKCIDVIQTEIQSCKYSDYSLSEKCTTDGTNCIPLEENCFSYKVEKACVNTSSGKSCTWNSAQLLCMDFQCSNVKDKKNCQNYGCISDGIQCISKSQCQTYETNKACAEGGTDGRCIFTKDGICKLFTQCKDANDDMNACNSKSGACLWSPSTDTQQSYCFVQTCNSAAKGTSQCVDVPNFDGTQLTICELMSGYCVTSDLNYFQSQTCYRMTYFTYTWNSDLKKCVSCSGKSIVNDSQTDNTTTNTAKLYLNILLAMYMF